MSAVRARPVMAVVDGRAAPLEGSARAPNGARDL